MSSVYGELKDDVLPKLRRAQLVNNMEITGKSDAEMLALVNDNKLDELTNEELLYIAEQLGDNSLKAKVLEYAAQKYNDSRAYTNLGATYLKEGATEKALAALKQAVKLGGNTQALNSNLALANLAAGNVDEAKKYATAADSKTKSLVSAAQGQYSAATSQLSGYNAAVAAVLNNDLSAAKKSLASETTADADYLRAVVATKEGDLKTAAAQLKAAIAKDASLAKKAVKDINLKDLFKSGFTL
jgi:tetratricopeptide (TPR) repeat protein